MTGRSNKPRWQKSFASAKMEIISAGLTHNSTPGFVSSPVFGHETRRTMIDDYKHKAAMIRQQIILSQTPPSKPVKYYKMPKLLSMQMTTLNWKSEL